MRKKFTAALVAILTIVAIVGVMFQAEGAPGSRQRGDRSTTWRNGGHGWWWSQQDGWWWSSGDGWWWDGDGGTDSPPTDPPPSLPPPPPTTPPPTTSPTPSPPASPSPSQPPTGGGNELRASISGTWVLVQVMDLQQLQRWSSTIANALHGYDVRGLSLRVPWNAMSDDLLDRGKAIADEAGKAYSVRVMAGRFTPDWVFDTGSPSYLKNGEQIPTPFEADGSSNTVFESAYAGLVSYLADYSRTRGVRLLHLPWYGQDWAELNNGAEVRDEPGYSESAFIAAHERLLDIAIPFSGSDLAIEFPMSGYGPLQRVSRDLTEHIVAAVGPNSPRVYVQSNGLSPDGDWGAPDQAVEAQMDEAVFSQPVLRGEQMIQPQTYDWSKVFANVEGQRCRLRRDLSGVVPIDGIGATRHRDRGPPGRRDLVAGSVTNEEGDRSTPAGGSSPGGDQVRSSSRAVAMPRCNARDVTPAHSTSATTARSGP